MIPAILRNDIAEVEALLNDTKRVDVNWKAGGTGTTALVTASGHNRIAITELLLNRGADPNIATDENRTALLSAAFDGNAEIVRLLIDAGADVNAAETRYGYTPLAEAARKGHADVVEILLEAGADRNARIKDGRTPEGLAQWNSHQGVLAVFARRPAQADEIDTD